ncbi:50S ribosomal protein L11 methyltransferase [Candidatus Nitrosoglobus terrae]|uniref:Ribosomal protein L11 methyltransferase n=1 Tax=Candidatus Nitrosoglobus terrae TaxID=1630141 RepID=A0A1Q2SK50_9GAMM|nr:50S ribosomal protein L11 methyltransferase [Candidatus Nitrosoglobus terrae]BAW79499.1 50S ribosomal protein L11 methyltransferase [Candidatus Nitrosoglobus terrae]
MAWIEIQFEINANEVDQLSNHLSELGAAAVTLLDAADQPLYEPPLGDTPLWPKTCVSALFPVEIDLNALLSKLSSTWSPTDPLTHQYRILADQNWERIGMEHFKPLYFGSRLWVCPSWLPVPDPNAINILLDPGLAFGTGTHPTTALCLEWLANARLDQARLIDYGCGSGILAIAALKLGASSVIAIDHDPQALVATQENAARNAITSRLQTLLPSELTAIKIDFLISNILANPLLELAPHFAKLVCSSGYLALSGITQDQIPQLIEVYSNWFIFETPMIKENWGLLIGHRH